MRHCKRRRETASSLRDSRGRGRFGARVRQLQCGRTVTGRDVVGRDGGERHRRGHAAGPRRRP